MKRRKSIWIACGAILGVLQAFAQLELGTPFSDRADLCPALRLGVLSDIHMTTPECAARDSHAQACLKTAAAFERALRTFREKGVDAIVIAGDLTEFGLVSELKRAAEIWRRVFPDDRGSDGEKVEKLFIVGNHDACHWRFSSAWTGEEWTGAERQAHWESSIAKDPAKAWRECIGEDYAPIQIRRVKGVPFVLASWLPPADGDRNWRAGAEVPGVRAFYAAHRDELKKAGTFFHVQHAHPKGTCLPFAVADRGATTEALSEFPRAIALSGHAHQPLTDERNVWQGAFTSIGTASLIDAGGRNWRENGAPFPIGVSSAIRMPYLRTDECRQGQYMRLYPDRLEIERLDFEWGLPVGADWIVPLDGSRAFAIEPRANRAVPPQFPKDAQGKAVRMDGRIEVVIPAATDGGRVYEYEIRAIAVADDYERIVTSKRILASDYHLPKAKAGRGSVVWFAPTEIQDADCRFDVFPIDCFGNFGRALRVE